MRLVCGDIACMAQPLHITLGFQDDDSMLDQFLADKGVADTNGAPLGFADWQHKRQYYADNDVDTPQLDPVEVDMSDYDKGRSDGGLEDDRGPLVPA